MPPVSGERSGAFSRSSLLYGGGRELPAPAGSCYVGAGRSGGSQGN